MVFIMCSLFCGYVVGYFVNVSDRVVRINSSMQTICMVLLIFTMGMGIGVNSEVLENLTVLGVKAMVFAAVASIGSILTVFLFSFIIEKKAVKK